MSLNLYQEAIIEAKQLKEVAEQNAKNKIIEALTPQIQLMIEQQLSDDFEEGSAIRELMKSDAAFDEIVRDIYKE